MKKFAKKHGVTVIASAIGAMAGYFYSKFIGCNAGSCVITSNTLLSTLYGAVMGGLIASIFRKDKKRQKTL